MLKSKMGCKRWEKELDICFKEELELYYELCDATCKKKHKDINEINSFGEWEKHILEKLPNDEILLKELYEYLRHAMLKMESDVAIIWQILVPMIPAVISGILIVLASSSSGNFKVMVVGIIFGLVLLVVYVTAVYIFRRLMLKDTISKAFYADFSVMVKKKRKEVMRHCRHKKK